MATFSNLEDDKAESISLKFTAGSLVSPLSNPVVVSPGPVAKLVILSNQSDTVPAGSPFQITVAAEDQLGNVVPSFIGNVTIALDDNPSGESLSGTLTATASAGVATFTGLIFSKPSGVYSLTLSSGDVNSSTPEAPVAPPTPAQIPSVTGESVVYFQKTNKKGKAQGKKTFSGFNIQYSLPMNSATAGLATNYQLRAITIKRKKGKSNKILTPVNFTANYDPSSKSVTLKIIGKSPFANGGQITILNSPPGGVSSQLDVPLTSSALFFKITPNAKQIVLS